jgi:uncharacterized protein YfaS (alpha-2-macroglobulin family)
VPTKQVAALRNDLEVRAKTQWRGDTTAAWLAGTYALLHLDADANAALRELALDGDFAGFSPDYSHFLDPLAQRGQLLYVLARHFPDRARALPPKALVEIAQSLSGQQFNTLSSSFVVLGLDGLAALGAEPETAKAKLVAYGADGKPHPLPLEGDLIRSARVPDDAVRFELRAEGGRPLYWQLVESGYDREAPDANSASGLDVAREIDDPNGAPVREVKLGDTLEVRVRSPEEWVSVALVDLLPAGFEVDLTSDSLQSRHSLPTSRPVWYPDYVDVREDRVVFYGAATRDAREFVYRIKATQSGKFIAPGAAAEGLYDRSAQAQGRPTEIRVAE